MAVFPAAPPIPVALFTASVAFDIADTRPPANVMIMSVPYVRECEVAAHGHESTANLDSHDRDAWST